MVILEIKITLPH